MGTHTRFRSVTKVGTEVLPASSIIRSLARQQRRKMALDNKKFDERISMKQPRPTLSPKQVVMVSGSPLILTLEQKDGGVGEVERTLALESGDLDLNPSLT